MKVLNMQRRIFAKLFLAHTISHINIIMDIALPNPRKINAGKKNVNICSRIDIDVHEKTSLGKCKI